ncbi:hypothetical protein YC2023_066228 [Brassica napus]
MRSLEVRSLAALGEWRSDLPSIPPTRTKRLNIFPKDIQKQISKAKRMGTLPDLSVMIAAKLGLTGVEGPLVTVPHADDVLPSGTRGAGKGKKRKRGGSGVERSAEETNDSENADEPTEREEGDVQKKKTSARRGGSGAEISGERNDKEGATEGEELETSLNAARPDGSEEDSEGSPLLKRRRNDEVDDEARSPAPVSPRERTPVPIGEGAVQIGTSSRSTAVLRRVPRVNFPDKVDFHYVGPTPLVYVPEKCGELLCQLRGRAKPLPAVKDLIFGSEYKEAARAKLLGDSTMNIVIDKYDTTLKGALDELELAKREFAEKEEASTRQLNESRADLERLNGMVGRVIARRDEFKAELEASRGVIHELERKNAELESERASLAATHEGATRSLRRGPVAPQAFETRKCFEEVEKLKVGEIPEGDLKLSPLVLESQFVEAWILAGLDPYGSNAGLIDPKTAANLHVSSTRPIDSIEGCGEDPTPPVENPSIAPEEEALSRGTRVVGTEGRDTTPPEESRRGNEEETGETLEEARTSPAARELSVRASELSALNDRESDREN